MASVDRQLLARDARGAFTGFANLFRKESAEWWRTRTWLIHSLIWLALINGVVFIALTSSGDAPQNEAAPPESGVTIYVIMTGLMAGFGTILVMQGAILDEKRNGTAAWVLSKPLSRRAFILAKLAAHSLAVLLIMVVLQGAIAFGVMRAFDSSPPALGPFVLGLALSALNLLFYVTLTMMLGVVFDERGVVLGIPIGLLFGAQILLMIAPSLVSVMPWLIAMPFGDVPALAIQAMNGRPLPTITPIIATLIWIVAFVGVALWRFEREEF